MQITQNCGREYKFPKNPRKTHFHIAVVSPVDDSAEAFHTPTFVLWHSFELVKADIDWAQNRILFRIQSMITANSCTCMSNYLLEQNLFQNDMTSRSFLFAWTQKVHEENQDKFSCLHW